MGLTAIKSVRLFDGQDVHPSATVIFDSASGTITSVSTTTESAPDIPEGAEIIDGSGKTLMPGLIEAHMHAHDMHLPAGADKSSVLRLPLKAGVTTICDMHSPTDQIHALWAQVKEDLEEAKTGKKPKIELADMKSGLLGATIKGGWPKPIVLGHDPTDELKAMVDTWPSLTVETAASFVSNHKSNGANYIKLMQENGCSLIMPTNSIPSASIELQTAVIDAAHAEGLLVVGHATARESTEIVLKSGADGLTHTFCDQHPTEDILDLYKKNNAFVVPTLVVIASLTGELQAEREEWAHLAYDKLGLVDEFTRQNMTECIGLSSKEATVEHAYSTIRMFMKHGIDIVAGTDSAAGLKGTAIGPSLWLELKLYVEKCGMSVLDALRSATGVSADRFKFTDRGKVEVGRRADLILVNGDPTTRLADMWEGEKGGVQSVWKLGLRAI